MKSFNRCLMVAHCETRPFITIDKYQCIDFSSNDYLGLRFHPELQNAYIQGVKTYGVGNGGSPLVCGYDELKQSFENNFADFVGMELGILVNSGYNANLCVISTLLKNSTTEFFIDKSVHASIYDALNLRGEKHTIITRFPHLDYAALANLLEKSNIINKVIVSEGIYSMTGQQADIKTLVKLKKKYQALLIIDDAHSIGVTGDNGKGSIEICNAREIDYLICPLGKAFSMSGAIICAQKEAIGNIVENARAYIYSTSIGTAMVKGLVTSLEVIKKSNDARMHLQQLIGYFSRKAIGLPFLNSQTAIQFLKCKNAFVALELFEYFKKTGFYCYPMRPPTVSKNHIGLRVVLSSAHKQVHIDAFFDALRNVNVEY